MMQCTIDAAAARTSMVFDKNSTLVAGLSFG